MFTDAHYLSDAPVHWDTVEGCTAIGRINVLPPPTDRKSAVQMSMRKGRKKTTAFRERVPVAYPLKVLPTVKFQRESHCRQVCAATKIPPHLVKPLITVKVIRILVLQVHHAIPSRHSWQELRVRPHRDNYRWEPKMKHD